MGSPDQSIWPNKLWLVAIIGQGLKRPMKSELAMLVLWDPT